MRLIRSTLLSVFLGTCAVSPLISAAHAQIVITIGVPPPPLPVYEQPPIPSPGYMWTPGYWAYDDDDGYFWVPGTWVEAPRAGLLWTPGYWGYDGGGYRYHDGYWGEEIGYYGGVDYGYGYTGRGYEGGYWRGGAFYYNRTVNNISNVTITNIYEKTIITNTTVSRVSYNGGQGGLSARPTPQQEAFARQPHVQPTPVQVQHVQLAQKDPGLRESTNKGRPSVAATSRPAEFKGPGVVQAQTPGTRPAGQQIPQGKNGPGKVNAPAAPAAPGAPEGAKGLEKATPPNPARPIAPGSAAPTPAAPGNRAEPNAEPRREEPRPGERLQQPAAPREEPRAQPPAPREEPRVQPPAPPRQEQRVQPPAEPRPEQRMQPPAAPRPAPPPQAQPRPEPRPGGQPPQQRPPGAAPREPERPGERP
jgi:YXWGXW repeat-containing protein